MNENKIEFKCLKQKWQEKNPVEKIKWRKMTVNAVFASLLFSHVWFIDTIGFIEDA